MNGATSEGTYRCGMDVAAGSIARVRAVGSGSLAATVNGVSWVA